MWKWLDQTKPFLFIFLLFCFKKKYNFYELCIWKKTFRLVSWMLMRRYISSNNLNKMRLYLIQILTPPQQQILRHRQWFEWKQKKSLQWFFWLKNQIKIFFPDILTFGRIIVDDCACGIFTYDIKDVDWNVDTKKNFLNAVFRVFHESAEN